MTRHVRTDTLPTLASSANVGCQTLELFPSVRQIISDEHAVQHGQLFGIQVEPQPPIDVFYTPGQPIAFGRLHATPHHTPGHCPGGVCLAIAKPGDAPKELFVGDTLFAGSIGRTDLPGGNYEVLIDSIRRVLFAFGDDAVVHSGHGPDTTIGRERSTNPFLVMADG